MTGTRPAPLGAIAPPNRAAWLGASLPAALVLALFAWNVASHRLLIDDAFISFRYAGNLVAGHGLVWNPGERVEGYTNFLWTLIMALGMRVGVTPELLSQVLGVASGLGVLAALVGFSARRSRLTDPFVWLAPLCLATSRSFTAWSTSGMETQFFSLLVLLANLAYLRERRAGSERPVGSALLFAAATWTRPDGALFAGVAGLCFLAEVFTGRRRLRTLLIWSLPYVLLVGGHVVWRYAYYGFLLPNTFYAKVGGFWGEQALRYLRLFAEDYHMAWFLPLLAVPVLLRREFVHGLFLGHLAAYLGYLLYVGGDRFEFRFLVPVFPYLYWMLAEALRVVADSAGSATRAGRAARAATAGVALGLLLATWLGSVRPEAGRVRGFLESIPHMRAFAARRAEEGRFLRAAVEQGLLPPDLRISTGAAGAFPYYSELYTVDYRGLSDVEVARQPLPRRGAIGHERAASWSYLRRKRVALFAALIQVVFHGDPESLPRYARNKRYVGPLRCVKVGDRYLVFATTLSEAEFRSVFGHLEIVY